MSYEKQQTHQNCHICSENIWRQYRYLLWINKSIFSHKKMSSQYWDLRLFMSILASFVNMATIVKCSSNFHKIIFYLNQCLISTVLITLNIHSSSFNVQVFKSICGKWSISPTPLNSTDRAMNLPWQYIYQKIKTRFYRGLILIITDVGTEWLA